MKSVVRQSYYQKGHEKMRYPILYDQYYRKDESGKLEGYTETIQTPVNPVTPYKFDNCFDIVRVVF